MGMPGWRGAVSNDASTGTGTPPTNRGKLTVIQRLLLNLVAALAISGMLLSSAFARTSGNLLVNGDGETGNCTADWNAVTTVPGWTVVKGSPTLLCYSIGGFTTPGSPAPGTAFIADGPYGDSGLVQTVDVRSAAKAIDRGGVTLNLSGWLGGRTIQSGRAQLTATSTTRRRDGIGARRQKRISRRISWRSGSSACPLH